MEFKDRFNQAVENSGKTRAQISRETGISEPLLHFYSKGETTPKYGKLLVLCKSLNVSPSWLMYGEEIQYVATEQRILDIYLGLARKRQEQLVSFGEYLLEEQKEAHDGPQN